VLAQRLRALAGIAGPLAFTGAWVASTLRQEGYSIAEEHLSGLAAPDARLPHLMTGAFLVLGGSTVVLAEELEDALGGAERAGLGPTFVAVGGWSTILAGLLRRDRMLLRLPGEVEPPRPSWRNEGHDAASAAIYVSSLAAPLLLARRFRDDPEWEDLVVPCYVSAGASVLLLALFASRVVEPWNGVVQRAMVSVPLVSGLLLSARLYRRAEAIADQAS
jgi:hypothetical protein